MTPHQTEVAAHSRAIEWLATDAAADAVAAALAALPDRDSPDYLAAAKQPWSAWRCRSCARSAPNSSTFQAAFTRETRRSTWRTRASASGLSS
jgi:hypothetical protein